MQLTVILLTILATATPGRVAQVPAPASSPARFTLAAVEVTGAKRLKRDDVATLAGLVIGSPVAADDLKPAAERAAASGLFTSLQYRYVTAKGRITVTFDVVEAEWTVPVTFDNFVWMSDEQIRGAVRRHVPSFDGTAPHTEGAPDSISRSLQKLLVERAIPGRVAFMPKADLQGRLLGYVFKVEDPSPGICAVEITGATPAAHQEVSAAATVLTGMDYSQSFVSGMAAATLVDVYRRLGHWRAVFAPPAVTVDAPGCRGVSLTLAATEGPSYAWNGAEWSGNTAIPSTTLDRLLAMKSGDVADGRKINQNLLAVSKAYRRQGFMQEKAAMSPRLDDGARTAVFEIRVEEGPQFRMGTVQFAGFSEAQSAALAKRWKLPQGEIYDDAYPADFMVREVFPLRPGGAKRPSVQTHVDTPSRVVNVRIVVE